MGDEPRRMNADEQWCFNRMREWIDRFNEVMDLYDRNQVFIPSGKIEHARALYKKLKEDLREEHRKFNSSYSQTTAAQDRWYKRTVHESMAHLRAPTNTRPEKWHSDLYSAREDFGMDLAMMRHHFGLDSNE